jgi:hypothetical protein
VKKTPCEWVNHANYSTANDPCSRYHGLLHKVICTTCMVNDTMLRLVCGNQACDELGLKKKKLFAMPHALVHNLRTFGTATAPFKVFLLLHVNTLCGEVGIMGRLREEAQKKPLRMRSNYANVLEDARKELAVHATNVSFGVDRPNDAFSWGLLAVRTREEMKALMDAPPVVTTVRQGDRVLPVVLYGSQKQRKRRFDVMCETTSPQDVAKMLSSNTRMSHTKMCSCCSTMLSRDGFGTYQWEHVAEAKRCCIACQERGETWKCIGAGCQGKDAQPRSAFDADRWARRKSRPVMCQACVALAMAKVR